MEISVRKAVICLTTSIFYVTRPLKYTCPILPSILSEGIIVYEFEYKNCEKIALARGQVRVLLAMCWFINYTLHGDGRTHCLTKKR